MITIHSIAIRSADPPDIPDIIIDDFSSLIDATADWHRITITDNMVNTFDNVVCVWFEDTKQIPISFDSEWRATEIEWVEDHNQWWWIFTWNHAMATRQWIKILKTYWRKHILYVIVYTPLKGFIFLRKKTRVLNMREAKIPRIRRCRNASQNSVGMHWVQTTQLHNQEKQKERSGQTWNEKILQVLP